MHAIIQILNKLLHDEYFLKFNTIWFKKLSICSITLTQPHLPLLEPNSRGEFHNYSKLLWFVHSRHSRSSMIKTNLISFQIKLGPGNLYYLIKQNANRKWNIHSDWLPTDFNLTKLHFALFLYLISYTPRQIKCYSATGVPEAFHWGWECIIIRCSFYVCKFEDGLRKIRIKLKLKSNGFHWHVLETIFDQYVWTRNNCTALENREYSPQMENYSSGQHNYKY